MGLATVSIIGTGCIAQTEQIDQLSSELQEAYVLLEDYSDIIESQNDTGDIQREEIEKLEGIQKILTDNLKNEEQEKEFYKEQVDLYKEKVQVLEDKVESLEGLLVTPYSIDEGYKGIKLRMELDNAIGVLGEPLNIKFEKTTEYGQFTELSYEGIWLEFLENFGLVTLKITKPEEVIIRNIKIGDSYVELLKQMPNKGFELSENDGNDMYVNHLPQISYDDENKVFKITYSPQWGIGLEFTVENDIITEAIFYVTYT